MSLLKFLAIFSIVSAQDTQKKYTYDDLPLRTYKLTAAICYVRKTTDPSFSIVTRSYDANGKFLHSTQLSVLEGSASIASLWNNRANRVSQTVPGYDALEPGEENELPAVTLLFLANSSHFGTGSLSHIGVASEVDFEIEHIKKIEMTAYGPDMLYCEENLRCEGPPPTRR